MTRWPTATQSAASSTTRNWKWQAEEWAASESQRREVGWDLIQGGRPITNHNHARLSGRWMIVLRPGYYALNVMVERGCRRLLVRGDCSASEQIAEIAVTLKQ